MVMCLRLRKRLIQLGLFIQKDDKTRYYRNISQLLGPILLLLILMPKQRLISTEAETIMSHSKGRQQKKYFGLSQCFPILQANSASDEFSKKGLHWLQVDYTDVITWTENNSHALTNLDHQVKTEHTQKQVYLISSFICLYFDLSLHCFFPVRVLCQYLRVEISKLRIEHLQTTVNQLLRLGPFGKFDSLFGLNYLVT